MAATKLIAVNQMLDSIGEARVNSLGVDVGDAVLAEQILGEVNTDIQSRGWYCNRLELVTLALNPSDNTLNLPAKTLRVLQLSGENAITLVGGKAFNKELNSFEFSADVSATVIVERDFADLPPSLRAYIAKEAAHKFHRATLGSAKVEGFTTTDVVESRRDAEREDTTTGQHNVITDNLTTLRTVNRNSFNRNDYARFPTRDLSLKLGFPPSR